MQLQTYLLSKASCGDIFYFCAKGCQLCLIVLTQTGLGLQYLDLV